MPVVSVIIPTYKHRDFILATLGSVFAQTFTDYEVIVINDGSPDDTALVLKPLAEAGRIRYIEQENQGQGAARNRGLAEAQGQFIALLDDDDLWPSDKLEWQVNALRGCPEAGMVTGPADMMDAATGLRLSRMPFYPEVTFEMLFEGNPIVSPGQTLVRADVMKRLNGLNADIWGADDWDLWFRVAKNSRIIMEDRTALFYQIHPNNASGQMKRMLDNACRVIQLHLPDIDPKKRHQSKLAAYHFLNGYLGWRVSEQMHKAVAVRDIGLLLSSLGMLLKIGKVLCRDRAAMLGMIRNVAPKGLRHQISRLRGRS